MTDPTLIPRLAREAGMNTEAMNCGSGSCVYTEGCNGVGQGELERFAALVAEHCAKVCEQMHDEDRPGDYAWAIREQFKEQP